MSNVLVTGGTGFIGLHLVEALVARGDRVRCLVRPNSCVAPLRTLGVELAFGDLDSCAALCAATAGVDVVYHVAGLVKACRHRDFYAVNEHGTRRLVVTCAKQAIPPRVLVVSSIAAAGPTARGRLRCEADLPSPVSHYGRSKLAAEIAASQFAASLPVTIVRPGIVFGPRDTGFMQVLRSLHRFRCHVCPGLEPPPLSFIHVGDLVNVIIAASVRGRRIPAAPGDQPGVGHYFAVAPEYPTYAEVGRLLRPMLGRNFAPILPLPGPLAYCVGGLNEVLGRMRGRAEELCVDKIREALVPSWACSGEAAKRDLEFVPPKTLAARFQETVNWCMAHGQLGAPLPEPRNLLRIDTGVTA